MGKRPVCLLCLLLMAAMCFCHFLGIPLLGGNPLSGKVQEWILAHPDAMIFGEVQRCTDTEISQSIYLKNAYLIHQSEKISIENIRVFTKEKQKVPVGTVLWVSGKLEPVQEPRNPGEFHSPRYYACDHIWYFLKEGVIQKKSRTYWKLGEQLAVFRERMSALLTEGAKEGAPVFQAMVLGDRSQLLEETKDQYQMGGIVHILAISGLHISLLGMGLFQLLNKTGMGLVPAGLLSLTLLFLYGMMTGGSVSAMRAVTMFLLSVGARLLGRCYDMVTALALSAIFLLLDAPANLLGSSFWLSFGAVLGIGVISPIFLEILGGKGKVTRGLVNSLGVQLVTLPAVLYSYGEISVAGIFLNLFVLPTVGVVLLSGVCGCLLGLVFPGVAALAFLPGRALLWIYQFLCVLAGKFSFCTWVAGQPALWQMAGYLLFLGAALWMGKRGTRYGKVFFVTLLITGILVIGFRPGGTFSITCLDVGQGDGIVMETPGRHHLLIDGGSSNKSKLCRYQLLPYLKSQGIRCLDGVFISHTDEDHISGVRELLHQIENGLTAIEIKLLVLPELKEKPKAYQELEQLAKNAGVPVETAVRGDSFLLDGVRLLVLSPKEGSPGKDVNEEAMVFLAEYQDFSGLFTGDIGEETEKELLPFLENVDFLKVGHHGSGYSSCEEFLERIAPDLAVISCSVSNRYGHPSKETVERLKAAGAQVEFTMKNGAICIKVQNGGMKVERFLTETQL